MFHGQAWKVQEDYFDMNIDFVIPWVDGSDSKWLAERSKYKGDLENGTEGDADRRFKDWGTLRYFFRGVAANAPWVRTIHFITCGHLPEWLDISNPKIHIVKHEDYIPGEYLPTFNSNVIELNVNRIEGLSERFVLFNDDMMILKKLEEEDFFHKGLPRLTAGLNAYGLPRGDDFYVPVNNASVLSSHFTPLDCVARHPMKWLSPVYGMGAFRTLALLALPTFRGFSELHVCDPYLKSTFDEVWDAEGEELARTSSHRFREHTDVSRWLIDMWQCAKGEFYPRPNSFGRAFYFDSDDDANLSAAATYIKGKRGKVVCLNDGRLTQVQRETVSSMMLACLDELYPKKCEFEI